MGPERIGGWQRAVVVVSLLAGCREAPPRPTASDVPPVGQWIWSRNDLRPFDEAARARGAVDAAVHIGSVWCEPGARQLRARAALTPAVVDGASRITAVIRFEDGLDRCRRVDDAPAFDRTLDSLVRVLRTQIQRTPVHAVQLDHDAPSRALPAWAASVRALRAGALAHDTVWVTSILAHLRDPAYGTLFRDVVAGHVLQVFDTGEEASDAQVREALRVSARASMPFRLGLGAFERETRRGPTEHRRWFRMLPQFARLPGYAGVLVFPAGHSWISLLPAGT